MTGPLRVTFYSYKGGVGRTLALLNVAVILARHGHKVVAVDLDLEAPGFGLSSLTSRGSEHRSLGVSDLLLARRAEVPEVPLRDHLYQVPRASTGDRLLLMPAGTRRGELAGRIGELYRDPGGDSAGLFQLLVKEISDEIQPDYLFFDSRTGLADLAGICTVELPQLLVAVCGLNEQNINGMHQALEQITKHPARGEVPLPIILVLSPVPRSDDLGLKDPRRLEPSDLRPDELLAQAKTNLLLQRIQDAHQKIGPLVLKKIRTIRQHFEHLDRDHLFRGLDYDPLVALGDELHVERQAEISTQYRDLARSISRARGPDEIPEPEINRYPIFVGESPSHPERNHERSQ